MSKKVSPNKMATNKHQKVYLDQNTLTILLSLAHALALDLVPLGSAFAAALDLALALAALLLTRGVLSGFFFPSLFLGKIGLTAGASGSTTDCLCT